MSGQPKRAADLVKGDEIGIVHRGNLRNAVVVKVREVPTVMIARDDTVPATPQLGLKPGCEVEYLTEFGLRAFDIVHPDARVRMR